MPIIAIDGMPLLGRGGISRYLSEIMPGLDRSLPGVDFVLYVDRRVEVGLPSRRWRVRVVPRRVPSSYLWLRHGVARDMARNPADLFWGVRSLLPVRGARRWVVTVHDLNVRVAPSTMPAMTRLAHTLWMERDMRRADALVAVSAGTASRLRDLCGLEAHAIVRPGVHGAMRPCGREEIERIRERYGLAGPYLLHVGTVEPRKNIAALVEAVGLLRRRRPDAPVLALAGQMGWKCRRLARLLRRTPDTVRLLGAVPDSDLPALYSGAEVVVLPSLYEGFGIPAAEARACGARVVATDIPELRESAGEEALFVAPAAEAIAAGLERALRTPPPPPVVRYTWEEAGRRMAEIMGRLLSGSPPGAGGSHL